MWCLCSFDGHCSWIVLQCLQIFLPPITTDSKGKCLTAYLDGIHDWFYWIWFALYMEIHHWVCKTANMRGNQMITETKVYQNAYFWRVIVELRKIIVFVRCSFESLIWEHYLGSTWKNVHVSFTCPQFLSYLKCIYCILSILQQIRWLIYRHIAW